MFKRATRELAKQSIGADDFDPEAIEEVLAGVSSDESDDDSDLETTPSITAANDKKRKIDAAQEDYDSSDEESEDQDSQDEDASADQLSEDDEEETELVYNCDICPDRRLTSEKLLNEHLQSKIHLRRLKLATKAENIKNLTPKQLEQRKEQLEKAKLLREEKNRQRIKAKRAAKNARAYFRQHPEAANNKEVKKTDSSKKDQPVDTKAEDEKSSKDNKVKKELKTSKANNDKVKKIKASQPKKTSQSKKVKKSKN